MHDIYHADITADNIDIITYFDLTSEIYHGGSTLSSGALPKWDLLDNTFMIKRCSMDNYGNHQTDAVNEELIHLFCEELDIPSAYNRVVYIKYRDDETDRIIEAQAAITKIFDGLVHYRDIRRRNKLGRDMDEYLEFSENFKVQPVLNDMLFIDFITNQSDRHSKNFGLVGDKMFPIFDSGACLFFDIIDSELSESHYNKIPNHKTFGKKLDELLLFALKYVHSGFSFVFDEKLIIEKFLRSLVKVEYFYSAERLKFMKEFVSRRIKHAGCILVEAQKFRNTTGQVGNR